MRCWTASGISSRDRMRIGLRLIIVAFLPPGLDIIADALQRMQGFSCYAGKNMIRFDGSCQVMQVVNNEKDANKRQEDGQRRAQPWHRIFSMLTDLDQAQLQYGETKGSQIKTQNGLAMERTAKVLNHTQRVLLRDLLQNQDRNRNSTPATMIITLAMDERIKRSPSKGPVRSRERKKQEEEEALKKEQKNRKGKQNSGGEPSKRALSMSETERQQSEVDVAEGQDNRKGNIGPSGQGNHRGREARNRQTSASGRPDHSSASQDAPYSGQ